MSQAGGERPNPYNTPQQKAAFDRRARQFGRLWLSRRQRQVVPQLLQMLANEPTPNLRERIVIALGRIEDPRALKPLQSLLERARQAEQLQARLSGGLETAKSEPWRRVKIAVVNPGGKAPIVGGALTLFCAPRDVVVLAE